MGHPIAIGFEILILNRRGAEMQRRRGFNPSQSRMCGGLCDSNPIAIGFEILILNRSGAEMQTRRGFNPSPRLRVFNDESLLHPLNIFSVLISLIV